MKKVILSFLFLSFLFSSCSAPTYIVTYLDSDGKVIEVVANVSNLEEAKERNNYKEGYIFKGWESEIQGNNVTLVAQYEDIEEIVINTTLPAIYGVGAYPVTYKYRSDYFVQDNTVFNKDLAYLSLGAACFNRDNGTLVKNLVRELGFIDIYQTEDTYQETSKDSVAYTLAHKKIGREEVILLSIRGSGYYREWESNITIGEEGEHEGFYNSALQVYSGLKTYINNLNNKKIKLWLTGFSRGAAICSLFIDYMMQEENRLFADDSIYAYCFEGPVFSDHIIDYPFLKRIINHNDLVGTINVPRWGFVEQPYIDIYSQYGDEYYAEFTGHNISTIPNISETYEEIIDLLTSSYPCLSNRQDGSEFLKEVAYIVGLLLSSDEVLFGLADTILDKSVSELLSYLTTNKLYRDLSALLDEYAIEYDNSKLEESISHVLTTLVSNKSFIDLVRLIRHSASSIAYNHYPEYIHSLLLHYEDYNN